MKKENFDFNIEKLKLDKVEFISNLLLQKYLPVIKSHEKHATEK